MTATFAWYTRKPHGTSRARMKQQLVLIGNLLLIATVVTYFFLNRSSMNSLHDRFSRKLRSHKRDSHSTNNDKRLYLENSDEVLSRRNSSRDAMFYILTDYKSNIRSRYLCGVESAARLHPERDIYLLIAASPIVLNMSENVALDNILKTHSNIHVCSVDLEMALGDTIFHSLYKLNFHNSRFIKSDVSEALRVLTVYKYGGTYLDLDLILLRPLNNSFDFISAESSNEVGIGVLNFVDPQNPWLYEIMHEMKQSHTPDKWGQFGPRSVQRILLRHCHNTIKNLWNKTCDGVFVLPPNALYAMKMTVYLLFDASQWSYVQQAIRYSQGIYLWNSVTSTTEVTLNSSQPLSMLARQMCPVAYHSCSTGVF